MILNNNVEYDFITRLDVGEYTIIESGVYILPEIYSSTKFYFNDFILELVFNNDESNGKTISTNIDTVDEKYLRIICKNWNVKNTTGLKKPIPVFTIEKYTIYIMFFIEEIETMPKIIYTFYTKIDK